MASIASEYLADVLEPEKFAAAIFGVTLAFTILAANTVGLRTWFRLRNKQLGSDDYLMCTALLVNLVHNSIVMHGTFVGIGSPDSKLNAELEAEGKEVRSFILIYPDCELPHLIILVVPLPLANLLHPQSGLHQDQHPNHPKTGRQGKTLHLHSLGPHRHRKPAQCRRRHHSFGQVQTHHIQLDRRGHLHRLGRLCGPLQDRLRL